MTSTKQADKCLILNLLRKLKNALIRSVLTMPKIAEEAEPLQERQEEEQEEEEEEEELGGDISYESLEVMGYKCGVVVCGKVVLVSR